MLPSQIILMLGFLLIYNPKSVNLHHGSRNPCELIRNGQFVCQDCETLAFCVQQNGVWTTLKLGTCNTAQNLFCNEQAQGCIFQKKCELKLRGPEFECQNPGLYPDPYNCRYYHECNALNEVQHKTCPKGKAYSPASKTCSLNDSHDICRLPQYNCTTAGQMDAWPMDENIFYICKGDIPMLYSCPESYKFIDGKCVNGAPATAVWEQSKSCVLENVSFPNPEDCNSYYTCTNGVLVKSQCPSGTYYNIERQICVFGSC